MKILYKKINFFLFLFTLIIKLNANLFDKYLSNIKTGLHRSLTYVQKTIFNPKDFALEKIKTFGNLSFSEKITLMKLQKSKTISYSWFFLSSFHTTALTVDITAKNIASKNSTEALISMIFLPVAVLLNPLTCPIEEKTQSAESLSTHEYYMNPSLYFLKSIYTHLTHIIKNE